MNLTLTPTRQFMLSLQGGGNSLTITQGSDALVMALAAVLKGDQGPPGYGLLGFVGATDNGTTVTIDLAATVGVYTVTLTGNRTLAAANGSSSLDRKRFILEATQGGTGGYALTPAATIGLGVDIPNIDLSVAPGVTDALGFIYRHADGKCHLLALNHGA